MLTYRLRELLRAGVANPFPYPEGGGKGSTPAAPDYTGAAEAQGASGKENLTQQTWANRPQLNTPWGQQTWDASAGVDPTTGQPVTQWESNINLTPAEQSALESQQRIKQGTSNVAESLVGQAGAAFQRPFDWDSLPAVPGSIGEAQGGAYQKMSAMLQPQRQQQEQAMETRLANMGLSQGTEAYKRAKDQMAGQWANEDEQLLTRAMSEGRADTQAQSALRGTGLAEQIQRRGMTLNELNALLYGQQVQMPGMPSFGQSGVAPATQYSNAAQQAGDFALKNQDSGPDIGSAIGGIASVAAIAL